MNLRAFRLNLCAQPRLSIIYYKVNVSCDNTHSYSSCGANSLIKHTACEYQEWECGAHDMPQRERKSSNGPPVCDSRDDESCLAPPPSFPDPMMAV